ncbi:MAG TPA: DUF4976 domain-containing protein [Verrucomicrobiales bacterium]|nr:DUF4976 domain-containing protein [Verrucomicrobiales bacterium]
MNPIRFILFAIALATCASANLPAKESTRPNILFFLSDDHRWDRMGCAGHPFLKTPVMDRLASQGVRFRNMFVTTSICAASRATIFTGLYERSHQYTFGTPPLSSNFSEKSYPALLKKNGYRTGFIGKFGISVEKNQKEAMFDYFKPIGRNPYLKKQKDGSLRHETELAGDRAIEFLNDSQNKQPFCLSVSFNAAHAEDGDKRPGLGHFPWPKAVDGLYEDIDIPEPKLSAPEIFENQPQFLKDSMNRVRYFWRWDTPEKYRANLRAYYRMITGLDRVMGRVLEELKKTGMADNTIVIFSGDNGYYEGQRGFAGKWSHYEESLRVPLIIYDPRMPESERSRLSDLMVLNTDIAPTLCEYAGISIPSHYQGRSLVPIAESKKLSEWRTQTFAEHLMEHEQIPKWEGVRGMRYVYARYFEQDPPYEFLHDLETDRNQLINLATQPEWLPFLKQMRNRCDQFRDQYGGPYDPSRVQNHKKAQKAKRAAKRNDP